MTPTLTASERQELINLAVRLFEASPNGPEDQELIAYVEQLIATRLTLGSAEIHNFNSKGKV